MNEFAENSAVLRLVHDNLPLISVAGKLKVKFLMKMKFFMKSVMKVI